MGCAQSKIENEESVSRCKDRRNFMKEAVSARNAFASGHSGYAMALKNTGAALNDYGQGEADNNHHPHQMGGGAPPSEPASMMDERTPLPPPPPPLPSFSPVTPLQRAVTMPEFSVSTPIQKMKSVVIEEDEDEGVDEINNDDRDRDLNRRNQRNVVREVRTETPLPPPPPPMTPPPGSKGGAWDYFFDVENMPGSSLEHDEDVDKNDENGREMFDETYGGMENVGNMNGGVGELGGNMGGLESKTPEKVVMEEMDTEEETPVVKTETQFMHSNTAPADVRRAISNRVGSSVSLLKLLNDIDDHFLKASECAQEVSKMLEATRLHYHSNFADNRGHIDHAARVMRVITWNRSFRGAPNGDGGKDDFDAEEYETHATVLDKLLAWEKKLFDEVKAGELMKLEYQRKVAQLNKVKKRGGPPESLEKTKAAVSHLHTRYIVDMQSLDSTVSEVDHIRDDQLYPKLVALVDGMAKMWESMCIHHDNQLRIVIDLKSIDASETPKETTKHHHDRTVQLLNVVQEWHSQFEKLVINQKNYVQALNSWLKLNLIPIESSLKEKISSPPRIKNPPIQPLLQSWHDLLEKLPDELAKSAIASFAAVIKTITVHQDEEMKLKEKCQETRKEFLRKNQAFDDWYQKYMQKRTPPDETDPERGETTNPKDPISEKQFAVDSLKKRLEEEVEDHQKHCIQVREKSLGSLKTRLPELFRAMSDYSHACSDAYERLRLITQSHKLNGGS
ncbi:protein ALTERED PHOSPHATE STARVATION RESPONSE 1 [Cornus florida]|uniref:protein ALTERED PHOSPHATE STARVATION RESPONSE 1 n=1 Tax=Cornus florida TaxID=4283 RepID=UPI00289A583D|nr:protein ALTERED PHOSPHATE STARVATION RESPONSE 1 [Cornus florida]